MPFDPELDDVATLEERIRTLARDYRDDYRGYVERHRAGGTQPADPDARVILIQHVGLIGVGTSPKEARLSRDLYHRAIEVMGGAQTLGGFTSLTEEESFAVEYWPLELYKLSLRPPRGELHGRVALVTGAAGGIGRAVVDGLARRGACVVAFDLDEEGAAHAVAGFGDGGVSVGGDVTHEDAVRDAFSAAVEAFGGVDIVVSNAGVASSAPIEATTLEEWERIHAVLGTGYFLVAREAFSILRAQGRGGSIVVVASKNALVAGKNAAAYSSAKGGRAPPRTLSRGGGGTGRDPREHDQSGCRPPGLPYLGFELARGARGGVRDRAEQARGALPQEDGAGSRRPPGGRGRGGAALLLRGTLRKSTSNVLNVDGGVSAAYPR